MERSSCLYEKSHALFYYELCLRKQLGVLSEKKKEMFTRKLASIEDLKRSEQGMFGSVGP